MQTVRLLSIAAILVALCLVAHTRNTIWQDDLRLWNDVTTKSVTKYTGYVNIGSEYEKLGNLPAAIENYSKALAVSPTMWMAYNKRGFIYTQMGKFDTALEDYNQAIAIHPFYGEAYSNRGRTYGQLEKYEMAIKDLQMALMIDPDNVYVINNLGTAFGKAGQHEKAIEHYSRSINLGFNAYVNRGKAYIKTGKMPLAQSDFQKACALGDKEGCNSLQEVLAATNRPRRN